MAKLGDLLERLDPDPVRRGSQFERICKWFLTHEPVYAHELRQVWLWTDWPGRWGADAGIDLIAEDRHGRLWAIQAKAYNADTSITKRDVDTFLAESGRSEFSFRLLIATTNLIGRTAKRTIEAQEKQASVLLLGDLDTADLAWPSSPSDLRGRRPTPKRVRPHQRKAMNDLLTTFHRHERCQLVMACGTGKTLTALHLTEKIAAKRTLVLVPSLSLLAQTLREWTVNARTGFDFLPVCSDETVAEPDAVVATTSDIGCPVTTDPVEIAAFLCRRSGSRVVFATYQSSPQIAEAFRRRRVPTFDLVIADEAHRCAGRIASDFATVLDSDAIKARRRLFMTATPRYFTGRVVHEAREADFEIASMNDSSFGPVAHRLGFAEAIDRKLLTDYRVVVVGVDDATYQTWAQHGRFVTTDGSGVTDARTLAGQIGLAKAMRRFDLHRTITFHSRVKRARDFARSLPQVIGWMPARQRPTGSLWADYVSGDMSAGQRYARLHRLGGSGDEQRMLLANARCLAEGVDVPTLDSVAFIDPRRSEVDIVQAVGRAIRLATDKTIGTIVVPVFVGTDDDPVTTLESSEFRPVWDVLKALRSHDDQLGQQLDELRRELGRHGGRPRLPSKIIVDLPVRVGIDFTRAFDVRLVEQTTATWEFWFGMLESFVERTGAARVPATFKIDGYQLGAWVNTQRTNYANGKLKIDRQRRLEQLQGWWWEPHDEKWEEGYRRLVNYVHRNSDAHIPDTYADTDGYQLGSWARTQRTNHRKGNLAASRKHRLEKLRGWRWDPFSDQWEEAFTVLQRYVDVNGNALVPNDATFEGYALGRWAMRQRSNRWKATLNAERQHRLEQLPGWTWDSRADRWERGFAELSQYVELNQHSRVPHEFTTSDDFRLGFWVLTQRLAHSSGTLSVDHEERLELLSGWSWDPNTDKWEEGFSHLMSYVNNKGDALVPKTCVFQNYPLGSWVNTQRGYFAKGTLDTDRQRRLEDLPGWAWGALANQWDEAFSRLLRYVKRHGTAKVPRDYLDGGYALGEWVRRQRRRYATGKLEIDRQNRLEVLTGWTWSAR